MIHYDAKPLANYIKEKIGKEVVEVVEFCKDQKEKPAFCELPDELAKSQQVFRYAYFPTVTTISGTAASGTTQSVVPYNELNS